MGQSLRIGLSGTDLAAILTSVPGILTPQEPPSDLSLDDQETTMGADWTSRMLRCDHRAMALWPGAEEPFLSLTRDKLVRLNAVQPADPEAMLAALVSGTTPFELASFASIHRQWARWDPPYRPRSFGGLHYPHGWLCGFRGKGHDHLVSRRWLDFGPWRVLRGPDDVTLVQFHDVEADAATAAEQARAGHPLLEIASPVSGFIAENHTLTHDLQGVYDAGTRSLRVIVHGRDVPPGEMLDACAARRNQLLGPARPIERVAYVFMEPERAHAHLHALWLRELECWTIDLGTEIRLDHTYHPTPAQPPWVRALESR